MTRYILRRIVETIPMLIGLSMITFAVLRLTGDPAVMVLGEDVGKEVLAEYRAKHGLDDPIHVQYIRFARGVLSADFGTSLRYRAPVAGLLIERLPATLELGSSALLFSVMLGVPAGIFSAVRRAGLVDLMIRVFVLLGQAVPGFYLGILLIMAFSVNLGLLPTGGRGGLRYLILPTIALGTHLLALVVRLTRSSMLEVLQQDYMRTAAAKGLRPRSVIFRHALRNALIPLVTIIGMQVAMIFGGAIVTETVFSWPGVGRLLVGAIQARDFPIVQAVVLFISVVVVLMNLLVDISYAMIDPRVHYG